MNKAFDFPELSITLKEIDNILSSDADKAKTIIASLKQLSCVELSRLNKSTRNRLDRNIININNVLQQYPIKTFDDYYLIGDAHLTEMLVGVIDIYSTLLRFEYQKQPCK